jgi:hypothetical protein
MSRNMVIRRNRIIAFEYAPDSVWFSYQFMPEGVRDLGDLIIFFCKIQITIWYKGAYYVKS